MERPARPALAGKIIMPDANRMASVIVRTFMALISRTNSTVLKIT